MLAQGRANYHRCKEVAEVRLQKLQNPDLSSDLPVISATIIQTNVFITVTAEAVQVWDSKGHLTQTYRDLSEKGISTVCLDDRSESSFWAMLMAKSRFTTICWRLYEEVQLGNSTIVPTTEIAKFTTSTNSNASYQHHGIDPFRYTTKMMRKCALLRRIDNAHDTDISALTTTGTLIIYSIKCNL